MALVLSSISGSIQSSSRVGLTGSIVIANRPDGLFPSIPSDATFFVSGSSSSDYSVFGGTVVGSGSLLLKNASGTTQFNAAATGLTVSDSSGNSKFAVVASSGDTSVGGALTVTGASTLNGNVTVGDASADTVTVNGTTTFAGAGVTTTFAGDVAVNGGDMTSSATTFNLLNATVTTLNLGGAATAVEIGAATGTTSINNDLTVDGNAILGNASSDSLTVSGSARFLNGLSGSLTRLSDGSSYLIAGSNIVVTTGSNGAITIAGTMNASTLVAGTDTQIQFNDGGSSFGGDAGLTYNKTTDTLTGVTGSFYRLTTADSLTVNGNLTIAGISAVNGNIALGDASSDTVTVNGTTTFAGAAVTTTFAGGSQVGGVLGVTGSAGFNGSVTLGDASADTVTVNGTTTFAGASVTTTFAGNSQVGGVLGVTGSAGFNGNVTLGDASADTVTVNGTTTFAGSGVTTTFAGDVAVNGGDMTSSATTFNLLNATVTTLNLGGAATAVEIGAATGTTSVNNSLTVDGNTILGNASSDTLTVSGSATFLNGLIGSLTSSNLSAGQVAVGGTGGLISGSSGLFWHNASGSLGIGTTQPSGKLEVVGASGSLFTVTDSMSGSLLSVNNSSGLAIFEVYSDNRMIAGANGANALVVSGSRVAVGTTPTNTTEFLVSGSSTASDKVLLVKAGISTQTGALIDAQNSAGTSVFIVSNTGLSGSHTKLTDGTSAFIAGTNVTVTTGSNGAITIAASMNAGSLVGGVDTQLQFNDGGAFGGDSGLTYNKTTDTLTGVTGSFYRLTTSDTATVGGGLTVTGAATLNGNVTVGDASADTVTVNGTTTFAGSSVTTTFAGNATINGNTTLGDAAADTVTVNGTTTFAGAAVTTTFAGNSQIGGVLGVTGSAGFNGNVTLGDASADTVTVNGTTTFAGSGVTTTFAGDVAVNGGDMTSSATTFNLLNATVTTLNLGGAATAVEIGAATGTTSINNSLTVDGNTILGNASSDTLTVSGSSTFLNGLSGSLTRLSDGSSYLIAGNNITIATGSNGAVTISTQADITDVNAGTGLTGGGSSGSLTLAINDGVVATVSGTTFTGAVKFNAGLSGSLTKLTDGSSAFVAGNNVTITTGSNGSVTIAASMNAGSLVAGTDTQIQFNDGGTAFGGDAGLTYNKTTDTLTGVTGSFFTLSTSGNSSVGGALTVTGASTLNGNVTVGDASADTVTVNGTTTFAGAGVTTTFAGAASVGGALTVTGASTLNGNVTVGDASADTVTVNGTTTFAGASVTTTFAGNSQVGGVLGVTGSAGFNGSVTLGDASADTVTVNGTTTFAGSGVTTTFAGDVAVNGGDMTSSATTFNLLNSTVTTLNLGGAATAIAIGAATGTTTVNNSLVVSGSVTLGDSTSDSIALNGRLSSSLLPGADVTYNLGSSSLRWANIYTGDLHLKNDRGDYTLIEEEDFLTIRFNKTGKRYKFMLEAVPEFDETLGEFSNGPKG